MVGVAREAIAFNLGVDLRAAAFGVLEFLKDDNAGTGSHHETIAVFVVRPRRAFRLIVEAGREGAAGVEARNAETRDGGFRATGDHDVRVVERNQPRGVADRDFLFPEGVAPTVVAFTQSRPLLDNPYARTGVKVITIPDLRWKRRDIKSTSLLAQTMGKQQAKLGGAYEAWMVEDGYVTEGTSSTAFILDADGCIVTQPLGHHILPGVTRRAVLRLAEGKGLAIEERPFTVMEAMGEREAFMSAASAFVLPVVEIDGAKIGDGRPGPVALEFRRLYIEEAMRS